MMFGIAVIYLMTINQLIYIVDIQRLSVIDRLKFKQYLDELGALNFSYTGPAKFPTIYLRCNTQTGHRYGPTSEYACTTLQTKRKSFTTVICSCALKWIKLFCIMRLEV